MTTTVAVSNTTQCDSSFCEYKIDCKRFSEQQQNRNKHVTIMTIALNNTATCNHFIADPHMMR